MTFTYDCQYTLEIIFSHTPPPPRFPSPAFSRRVLVSKAWDRRASRKECGCVINFSMIASSNLARNCLAYDDKQDREVQNFQLDQASRQNQSRSDWHFRHHGLENTGLHKETVDVGGSAWRTKAEPRENRWPKPMIKPQFAKTARKTFDPLHQQRTWNFRRQESPTFDTYDSTNNINVRHGAVRYSRYRNTEPEHTRRRRAVYWLRPARRWARKLPFLRT